MTKPGRSSSDIGRSNSARGKAAERAVVTYYRATGWPHAERTVRTGSRSGSRVRRDHGDIDGTPGIVTQVKCVDPARLHMVGTWLAATDAQARAAGADLGVLVIKRPGHANAGRWWAYLRLYHLVGLAGGQADQVEPAITVRLELADLVTVLRTAGYGTPLDAADATLVGVS